MMEWLSGKKTYLSALGMFGLALHQAFIEGNFTTAMASLMAALGLLGLRSAVAKVEPPK